MKALVTGGAGFIGSTLVDRLLAEGHAVDVVDNLSTGSLANLAEARRSRTGHLTFHQLDIRSPDLAELMNRRRPEVVFHLAAQADVRVSVADPLFDADVNVMGSLRVLEGARSSGARKVVFASSGGTIYGDPDPADLPVKESHPQRPLSPYGVSKKVVGDYLAAYRELHNLEFTALALANVYGPRQDPHGEAGVVAIFAGPAAGRPALHHLRRRHPDPGLRLRRRRGRRLRPGRRAGRRPGPQHRHRAPRPASTSSTRPWPRQPAWTDPAVHAPARPGELAPQLPGPGPGRHPPGVEALDVAGRGHRGRPRLVPGPGRLVGRRPTGSAEKVLVVRPDDLRPDRALPQPGRVHASHDGHRDRRTPCPSPARRRRPARRPRRPR